MDSPKVSIIRYGRGGGACAILNAERADWFGLQCIKGKTFTAPGNWAEGSTAFIPLDKIDSIMEFNSAEEATASMQRWKPEQKPTPQAQKRRGWFGSK
jgi:hypothetical protein